MGRDIIFCIELDNKSDVDFVKNYISIFFRVNFPTIKQTFHQCYMKESYDDEDSIDYEIDLLQRGLECLSKIQGKCKICETWIFYIGVGSIYNYGKCLNDVTLVLLDKNPKKRECIYSVHKNKLDISKTLSKDTKFNNINILANSLKYLFTLDESNCRIIKYKNYKVRDILSNKEIKES